MEYFNSETKELKRSEIKLSSYNPRTIDEEGKKQLKRSIKKYGIVGGIVINKQTSNTIVGGHQKVKILDEINKYPDIDYTLKVEVVDVDIKTEKQLNIILNNPNVGGTWDFEKMREMIPDIDYKDAGLTDADLNMIGVDFLLKTNEESNIATDLDEIMQPIAQNHQMELEQAKALKQAAPELTREEKIQQMKDLKAQVKENAQKQVSNMEAYFMISFDSYDAKASFCQRMGFEEDIKFIKGELFDKICERVFDDEI